MTVDCPLTCYICGQTDSDWMTVDLMGTFVDSETASERFKEKHGEPPESFLFICPGCEEKNPHHAKNTREKYGVYEAFYEDSRDG